MPRTRNVMPGLRVRALLGLHLAIRGGAMKGRWRKLAQAGHGVNKRTVYRVDPLWGKPVIIKCFKTADRAEEDHRLQARRTAGLPNCARPLFLSPRGAFRAIEAFDGHTLADRLMSGNPEVLLKGPSRWLRGLHESAPRTHAPLEIAELLDSMAARRRFIKRPHASVTRALEAAREALPARLPTEFGRVHGDFHLRNVLLHRDWRNRDFRVIDFAEDELGPLVMDLVWFILHLQIRAMVKTPKAGVSAADGWFGYVRRHYGPTPLLDDPVFDAAMRIGRIEKMMHTLHLKDTPIQRLIHQRLVEALEQDHRG